MIRLAVVVATLAACGGGGGGKPAALPENHAAPTEAMFALRDGSYPCGFRADGYFYGPYRCVVSGTHFTKEGGFEAFTGTLSAAPGGAVHVDARTSERTFSLDLLKNADGTFRGKVSGANAAEWYLGSGSFEVVKGAFGGDQYGGAGYGGAAYGGGG